MQQKFSVSAPQMQRQGQDMCIPQNMCLIKEESKLQPWMENYSDSGRKFLNSNSEQGPFYTTSNKYTKVAPYCLSIRVCYQLQGHQKQGAGAPPPLIIIFQNCTTFFFITVYRIGSKTMSSPLISGSC